MQIDPYPSICSKLISSWIKHLNVNPTTWNLTEDNVGSSLEYMGIGDYFQNITPVAIH